MFTSSSKSGGVCIAFPDVCKTPSMPGGAIPIPYPSHATIAVARQQKKKTATTMQSGTMLKTEAHASPGVSSGIVSSGKRAVTKAFMSKAVATAEAARLMSDLSALHNQLQNLPATNPGEWQAVLEQYLVTASALFLTRSDDN